MPPRNSRAVAPGQFGRRRGVPYLQPAFVTYLDVLGTTQKAMGSDAQGTLEALDRAVEEARKRADMDQEWSWAVSSWFSDNLCIAASIGHRDDFQEGILGSVLAATCWVQYLLAIDGFFTRGGLSAGMQFMDRRTNFGPALVEAVALEKSGRYPQVIVGDAVRPWIDRFCSYYSRSSTDNPFRSHLATSKGKLFVNYLAVVYEADSPSERTQLLNLHRHAVRRNLSETAETLNEHKKARWSAGYHNWMCNEVGHTSGRVSGNFARSFESFVPTTWLGRKQP